MQLRTLTLLSAAGMMLASVSVYSLAPATNAAPVQVVGERGGGSAVVDPAASASGTGGAGVAAPADPGHFLVGSALTLEATLGNRTLARGTPGQTFVLLEVRGEGSGKATVRAPVNLAIVIDRSGSMKGQRIQNAMLAAGAAVDRLRDGDVASVVTFDTQTKVVVPPTVLDGGSRPVIAAGIRSIVLGGDTCVSCGVEQGLALLGQTAGRVSRMIVLSDGDTNSGIRDVAGFRGLAQRARDRGVAITTVGVNVDYNEHILGALAEESNGQHYFVEDANALSRAFAEEADALTSTLGAEAEVHVSLGPGVQLERVFDRSFRRAEAELTVPLGTFGKGEVKTVLLQVRVPTGSGERAQVVSASLSYRDLVSGLPASCGGALDARVVGSAAEQGPADPVVLGRAQRSETARALEDANRLFQQHKPEDARRRIEDQAARVQAEALAVTSATRSARSADVTKDLGSQTALLNQAATGFTPPPVAPSPASRPGVPQAQAAPSQPFEDSFQGKGAVKGNSKGSFDLRR